MTFKKQKYHCVYEYPKEASDSDSEEIDSPLRKRWDVYQTDVDYANYAGLIMFSILFNKTFLQLFKSNKIITFVIKTFAL